MVSNLSVEENPIKRIKIIKKIAEKLNANKVPNIDVDIGAIATKEDIISGKVAGLVYDPTLKSEAEAGMLLKKVRVGDKFFELGSVGERKHVLVHELAHYESALIGESISISLADIGMWGGKDKNGFLAEAPNGQYLPDEAMTESITLYRLGGDDREFLKNRYPMAYDFIEQWIKQKKIPEKFSKMIADFNAKKVQEVESENNKYENALALIRQKIQNAGNPLEKAGHQNELRKLMFDNEYPEWLD